MKKQCFLNECVDRWGKLHFANAVGCTRFDSRYFHFSSVLSSGFSFKTSCRSQYSQTTSFQGNPERCVVGVLCTPWVPQAPLRVPSHKIVVPRCPVLFSMSPPGQEGQRNHFSWSVQDNSCKETPLLCARKCSWPDNFGSRRSLEESDGQIASNSRVHCQVGGAEHQWPRYTSLPEKVVLCRYTTPARRSWIFVSGKVRQSWPRGILGPTRQCARPLWGP